MHEVELAPVSNPCFGLLPVFWPLERERGLKCVFSRN
jgi:hypothetical protein